jgi:uncharacterized membrane protein YfcA
MAHIDLINMPAAIIVVIILMLVIAGMTKGLIGIGMPIIAVPLLNLVVDLPTSVAILSVPLVISNIPQALEGDKIGVVVHRLLPVLCGLAVGVVIGVHLLASVSVQLLKPIVGSILIVVVLLMLLSPHFAVRRERSAEFSAGWLPCRDRSYSSTSSPSDSPKIALFNIHRCSSSSRRLS